MSTELASRSRVVVTRPEPEASRWADALRARGWPALALPLMSLGPPAAAHLTVLQAMCGHLDRFDALMFVSANAARHFFALCGQGVRLGPTTRLWAPGPGTADALRACLSDPGPGAVVIDAPRADAAQFDSEALWAVVAPQVRPGFRLLIVRGDSRAERATEPADAPTANRLPGRGRDWLATQCRAAGAEVEAVVAYQRQAPDWRDPVQAERLRQAQAEPSVWLFSNSEAMAALPPSADWSRHLAVVPHPRLMPSARALGFAAVDVAQPAFEAVCRVLECTGPLP